MTSGGIKSFGTLQAELELARSSLKGLDENIKKLIGRDPTDGPPRLANKRNANGVPTDDFRTQNKGYVNRNNRFRQNEGPPEKRRQNESKSVFSRLSGPPRPQAPNRFQNNETFNPDETNVVEEFYNSDRPRPKLQSRVIRELPSREEVVAAQGDDEKSRARSRRIFGTLLGTLQKFKQDETRLKPRDERKAQIEKKVEEQAAKELEVIKKTRQEMFMDRKRKQAEIRAIELKMHRMQEYTKWEEFQKPLFEFIETKAKPHLFYKPKIMNKAAEEKLKASRERLEKKIDMKRQEVFEELEAIETSTLNHTEEHMSYKRHPRQQEAAEDNEDLHVREPSIERHIKREDDLYNHHSVKEEVTHDAEDDDDDENDDAENNNTTNEAIPESTDDNVITDHTESKKSLHENIPDCLRDEK